MKTSIGIRLLRLFISSLLMAGLTQASEEGETSALAPQRQAPCPMLDYDALESAALICATQAEHAPNDEIKAKLLISAAQICEFVLPAKENPTQTQKIAPATYYTRAAMCTPDLGEKERLATHSHGLWDAYFAKHITAPCDCYHLAAWSAGEVAFWEKNGPQRQLLLRNCVQYWAKYLASACPPTTLALEHAGHNHAYAALFEPVEDIKGTLALQTALVWEAYLSRDDRKEDRVIQGCLLRAYRTVVKFVKTPHIVESYRKKLDQIVEDMAQSTEALSTEVV